MFCVSHLAEHGRNLAGDHRASLAVTAPGHVSDPLAHARITLAALSKRRAATSWPQPGRHTWMRSRPRSTTSTTATSPCGCCACSGALGGRLRADGFRHRSRLRDCGSDPVRPQSAGALAHLNADHAPALGDMARVLGGYPDATAAVCTGIDRYGMDLKVSSPRGDAYTQVGFGRAFASADELRSATVELARVARSASDRR